MIEELSEGMARSNHLARLFIILAAMSGICLMQVTLGVIRDLKASEDEVARLKLVAEEGSGAGEKAE